MNSPASGKFQSAHAIAENETGFILKNLNRRMILTANKIRMPFQKAL